MTTETSLDTIPQIIAPTETAVSQIKRILEQEGLSDQAVRVGISDRSPTGFSYQLEFCDQSEKTAEDTVLQHGDLVFLIHTESLEDLRGTTLDYVDTCFSAGF